MPNFQQWLVRSAYSLTLDLIDFLVAVKQEYSEWFLAECGIVLYRLGHALAKFMTPMEYHMIYFHSPAPFLTCFFFLHLSVVRLYFTFSHSLQCFSRIGHDEQWRGDKSNDACICEKEGNHDVHL